MALTSQSKPEKLATSVTYSSNQKGIADVEQSGIAAPLARNMISQRFDKPVQSMKLKELFDTHFKG